jgi:DNA-binding XRE family transcriptional regulator
MFRDNLTRLRKMHSMTQEDVAEKVGVSRRAIAKWEAEAFLAIADAVRSGVFD